MSLRHQVIITKIIMFYSIFVVVMKAIVVIQQYLSDQEAEISNTFALAQLIIAIPFIVLTIVGIFKVKNEQYSWPYVIVGAIVIIGIRAYELQLVEYLRELLLS